jgi:DNA (cytosine-5)-methyltransferase 1
MKRLSPSKPTSDNSRGTFVSLFSGCGGLDLGFTQAGMRCVGAYDLDAKALQVHAQNIKSPTFVRDLAQGATHLDLDVKPDLVLSGSPCQGFSTIGKRDIGDLRNKLLLRGAQIAVDLGARIFVAENVPAVAFGSHKQYWNQLQTFLHESGYASSSLTLAANDFGVAQMRKRLFLVAVRGSRTVSLQPKRLLGITLRDAIGDLSFFDKKVANHHPENLSASSTDFAIALRIKQSQKLCNVRGSDRAVHTWDIPEVFGPTTQRERSLLLAVLKLRRCERVRDFGDADPVDLDSLNNVLGWNSIAAIKQLVSKGYVKRVGNRVDFTHTFNGKYRRLSWDSLSHTVDTRFGSARNFLHPEEHRALTVREAARIQGFPDSFKLSGSIQDQFRFIGNAVSPPVAKALAIEIAEMLGD